MKSTMCILGVAASIITAVFLQHYGYPDLVGYAIMTGFLSLILLSPDKKDDKDKNPFVHGDVVDGIDFSRLGEPTRYVDDIKRLMEMYNEPGKVKRITQSRAGKLVRLWYHSKGLVKFGIPARPSVVQQWFKALPIRLGNFWEYLNKPIVFENKFFRLKTRLVNTETIPAKES